jgi:cephalosporin hydroxylase
MSVRIENDIVFVKEGSEEKAYGIGTPEAFRILSALWLRSGWDTKYVYGFSWLGRPIIQLPDDMIRIQEVVFQVQPDLIVETGIAHGGSLVYYASLCKAMDRGRVLGVDIEIRPHNREAIEAHFLAPYITMIEGSSIDPRTVAQVQAQIRPDDRVIVMLDSCHLKDHVRAEMEAYAPLVSPGSYIVAMDGIMRQVVGAPRTSPDWAWNNPVSAVNEFLPAHPEFELVEPAFAFNEGLITERVTYWPSCFLRRKEV